MIIVGLGANIPGCFGSPEQTLHWAMAALDRGPVACVARSSLLRTAPMGPVDQPDFINGVVVLETTLAPRALLYFLKTLEKRAGRLRKERWGPRTLDLDILDYHGLTSVSEVLTLPHPGLGERDFVLRPLLEIAPTWRHPISGQGAAELLERLGEGS